MTRMLNPGLLDEVPEKVFQGQVVHLAHLHGWAAFHQFDSRRSRPGWPDLVLLHERSGRALFRELKTNKGRLTKEQTATLRMLDACGFDADVWRPRDWPEIERVLAKPAIPREVGSCAVAS